jgi:signal transduction histidine kinase
VSDAVALEGFADLADVLGRTEDGVTVIDGRRRLVYANPAACRVLGRPLARLLDHDLLDSFDDIERARISNLLPTDPGHPAAPFVCVLRGGDDVERDVLCTTFALDLIDGVHCVVLLRHLAGAEVVVRTVNALAQSAQSPDAGTTEQILAGIARIAVEGTRAVTCAIVVEGDDRKMVAAAGFGFRSTPVITSAWAAFSVHLEDLPGAERLLLGKVAVVPDARSVLAASPVTRNYSATLHDPDWQAAVYAPLSRDGQVFGVLVPHLPPGIAAPSPAELAFFTALADQAAAVVINARMAASVERSRLARELHDSVSQALFSMTMHARAAQLSMVKAGLDETSPLGRSLTELVELAKGALAEMRALIFELRPHALAEEGLLAAVRRQAAALSARELLTVSVEGPERRLALAPVVEEHLYRIVSEALHNVVKHANASHAAVTVTADASHLRLTISDDGAGFDPKLKRVGHLGLSTMAWRAHDIGAELTITSTRGGGTRVLVALAHSCPDDEKPDAT